MEEHESQSHPCLDLPLAVRIAEQMYFYIDMRVDVLKPVFLTLSKLDLIVMEWHENT